MSESIYICATSLCCCLVVCALIRMIAPSGNTTKILSLVIGVFALCCLVSPVVTLISEIDINELNTEQSISNTEFSQLCDEHVLKTTGDYINSYVDVILKQADISTENIATILGVDENKGIYIRQMNIYINKADMDKADEIKNIISNSVGIVPKITET